MRMIKNKLMIVFALLVVTASVAFASTAPTEQQRIMDNRYLMGANPSIHIIVKNGHVTLEGVLSNQMDSQLAYTAARSVPGVFSVTNNLRVRSNS